MIDFFSLYTLLPFFFVIAVVYGALETVGMFRNAKVKMIIAVVMGFFAIQSTYFIEMIYTYLPYGLIFFIFAFVAGFAKKSLSGGEKDSTMIIIIIVLGLLLVASLSKTEGGFFQQSELLWFFGAIAILGIFYAAYKMKD